MVFKSLANWKSPRCIETLPKEARKKKTQKALIISTNTDQEQKKRVDKKPMMWSDNFSFKLPFSSSNLAFLFNPFTFLAISILLFLLNII